MFLPSPPHPVSHLLNASFMSQNTQISTDGDPFTRQHMKTRVKIPGQTIITSIFQAREALLWDKKWAKQVHINFNKKRKSPDLWMVSKII